MSGGLKTIRAALGARNKKINLAILAKDLGIPSESLNTFIDGRAELTPDKLDKVCAFIWGAHTVYDAQRDVLVPAQQIVPSPMVLMPRLDPTILPTYVAGPPPVGAQPLIPIPVEKKKREGWLGSWL